MWKIFGTFRRYRSRILVLVLLFFAFSLLFSQRDRESGSLLLQRAMLELSGPFQKGLSKAVGAVRDIWSHYLYLVDLREENDLLREIIQEMNQERIDLIEKGAENERLRALLGFRKRFQKPMLPAEVIGGDLSGWFQSMVVDRGKRDGIVEGMAVVSVQGIVGQIMESSESFSRVLLITDPNSAVAAYVQRTRARGIVKGIHKDRCSLAYLHRSEPVAEGDLVLSSGLDGVYPEGVLIGTVVRTRLRESSLFQEVDVQPSVDFRKLEEVLIFLATPEPTGRDEP